MHTLEGTYETLVGKLLGTAVTEELTARRASALSVFEGDFSIHHDLPVALRLAN